MDFLWGVILGMVAGPFVWELGKWGLKRLRALTAK
jgi:hypothetical protein